MSVQPTVPRAAPATTTATTAPPSLVWLCLGIVYVVWGSTYLGIRYVVESLPALLSAGARFATAGLLLASYLLLRRGRRALVATRRQYVNAAVVGLLLGIIGKFSIGVLMILSFAVNVIVRST